ncbi:MAG: hypothetical protein SFX18_16280 [Pirellulales bacterium]|nr:hypothetical protein [Pirellulales bacterium]
MITLVIVMVCFSVFGTEIVAKSPIDALISENEPVYLATRDYIVYKPLFPLNYNWQENDRVANAVKEIDLTIPSTWSLAVENMLCSKYSITVWSEGDYTHVYNYTRGELLTAMIKSALNRAIVNLMPLDMQSSMYNENASPGFKNDPAELQKWCLQRKDKKLYELQIETAEWAISVIREKSKRPTEEKEDAITAIQGNIDKLRRTQQPILPSRFFVTDITGYYSEETAKKIRLKILGQ